MRMKRRTHAALLAATPVSGVVPAESFTRDIDADSLQDIESQRRSGALDSDSQDSVMQISAESGKAAEPMQQSGDSLQDVMQTSADSLSGIPIIPLSKFHIPMYRSTDSASCKAAMLPSADSLELEQQLQQQEEAVMECSADLLEMDKAIHESQSRESFDRDSLHDENVTMMSSTGSLDTPADHQKKTHGVMEMSVESGAWSQSSSIFSSETVKSSDESSGDIMQMSLDSCEFDKSDSRSVEKRFSTVHEEEAGFRFASSEGSSTETASVVEYEGEVRFGVKPRSLPMPIDPGPSGSHPSHQPQSPDRSETDSAHSDTCYCGPEDPATTEWPASPSSSHSTTRGSTNSPTNCYSA